jgi:hypothetical protein
LAVPGTEPAKSSPPPGVSSDQKRNAETSPEMVVRAVLRECALSGVYTEQALDGVVRVLATLPGYSEDATRALLVRARKDYERENNRGNFRYVWCA